MTDADARTRILTRIRRSTTSGPPTADPGRLDHPIPARTAGLTPEVLRALFIRQATACHATVECLATPDCVPDAVLRYLQSHNLPAELVMAPDPALDRYRWAGAKLLTIRRGRAELADAVGITGVFAGIAETGTLLLLSGPLQPATLHLLPETHLAILAETDIVATYEAAWKRLQAAGRALPRTATLVTGPSRTGDIEQRMQLGAHGPRRLHILVVGAAGVP